MCRLLGPVVRIPSPLPHSGAPTGAAPRGAMIHANRHQAYQGWGYIAGTVTVEGSPAVRRVALLERRSSVIHAETHSSETGYYRFDNLDMSRRYTVISVDHADTFNAVVADNITPVRY